MVEVVWMAIEKFPSSPMAYRRHLVEEMHSLKTPLGMAWAGGFHFMPRKFM